MKRLLLSVSLAVFAIVAVIGGGIALSQGGSPGQSDVTPIKPDDVAACLDCHSTEIEGKHAVDTAALAKSPHKDLKCQDCHANITGAPHTKEMLSEKAECGNCHTDEDAAYKKCSHAKPDKVPGDHPTCVNCHNDHNDPHDGRPIKTWTREDRVKLCSNCHSQKDRMSRYGVDTDAVSSYDDSFHGKALLKFHNTKTAICTDCHGDHTVLPPNDPNAATNRLNGNKLCSKPECHPGATVNFAMSGANHLRLKLKQSPVLAGIDLFFKSLVIGVITFMLFGIALDLRTKVFGKTPPKSGRPIGIVIALSFLCIVAGLALATFDRIQEASYAAMGAAGFILLSFVLHMSRPANIHHGKQKLYPRFNAVQRWQHGLLVICFTTLIATGFPLHFYKADRLQAVYQFFGGLSGARVAHRIAAVGMIIVFLWHTGDLLVRWAKQGFSFKTWTMLPTWQDVKDFVHLSKHHVGLAEEPPRYGKFAFKQKLDYLAEYWGVPLMVVTGFILWFPIYWGNRLPEIALSAALVAHGWEATLAFLAIITWHMYNEHFNPEAFPMSKVWLTGTMDEEEMAREHPIEKERLEAEGRVIDPDRP
ncbi:MAG TPA: cytochrome b/b6 domain-containing protein [Fimbriimonadaceae bacterium]|nr:cytochrome b/b6 domain-containing protein [Fimbriimonadaceae bacterium]